MRAPTASIRASTAMSSAPFVYYCLTLENARAYRCAEKKGIFSSSNITSNIHILILFSNRFFVLFCAWIFFFLLFFRCEAHVHTQTDTALWSLDLAVATPVEKDDRSQAKTMRMDGTDATWLFSIGKLGQREGEKEEEEEKRGNKSDRLNRASEIASDAGHFLFSILLCLLLLCC